MRSVDPTLPVSGDAQRDFYNAAYASPTPSRRSRGLLERFELHRVDAVVPLLPHGGRLLDVGCGDGTLLSRCAPFYTHLVGIDVADVQIRSAHTRLTSSGVRNVRLVQANLDRGLPFVSEQFDVACAIAVLGLVFDPIAVLAELSRVLKVGGCLAIEALNLVYLPRRLALLAGKLPVQTTCHGWEGGHLHNFTRSSVIRLLEDSGFDVRRVTASGVLNPLRTWWPSMLSGNVIALATKR